MDPYAAIGSACGRSPCKTTGQSTKCKVVKGCSPRLGDYFLTINHDRQGTATPAQFSMVISVFVHPTPTDLPVGADTDEPVSTNGQVTGGPIDADRSLNLDFFQFSLAPPAIEGSRVVVEIVSDSPITGYLNRERIAFPGETENCFEKVTPATGATEIEIPYCELKVTRSYFLTIERTVANQAYTVKVFIEAPEVVDLLVGRDAQGIAERLPEVDSVRYYRVNVPAGPDASLLAIVENVDGGTVQLGIYYGTVPFQECSPLPSCKTDKGCHIRIPHCQLEGSTQQQWYIGVKVTVQDDEKEDVTYKVHAIIEDNTPLELPADEPTHGEVYFGATMEYKLDSAAYATAGVWVDLHIYVDASTNVEIDGQFFVSPERHAGNTPCLSNFKTCVITTDSNSIKSCSIQLDPCELSEFADGVYLGVYSQDSQDYLYFQETLSYTITPIVWNPSEGTHLLSTTEVNKSDTIQYAVAEGQAQVYRLSGFTGALEFAVSAHNYDNSLVPAQQNALRVDLVYGSVVQGISCECYDDSVVDTKLVEHGKSVSFNFGVCDAQGDGIYIVVRGIPDQTFTDSSLNLYHYIEDQFTITVQAGDTDSAVVTPLAEDEVKDARLPSGSSHTYRLEFTPTELLSKSLVVKTRSQRLSGFTTTITTYSGEFVNLACGANVLDSCTANDDNDGYCSINLDCFFTSDTQADTYLVTVTNPGGGPTGAAYETYSIQFILPSSAPRLLESGVKISSTLTDGLYDQYALEVPTARTQNLLVEVYFDAGMEAFNDRNIELYVHYVAPGTVDEKRPGYVGLNNEYASCYCADEIIRSERKAVYIVNACSLLQGTYKFSLRSPEPIYDTKAARYTIVATLSNPILDGFQIDHDFPVHFYRGQVYSVKFTLPETMFNNNDVDTGRVLSAKVFNVRTETGSVPQDEVSWYLSRTPVSDLGGSGSTCKCFDQVFASCSTGDDGNCEKKTDYCSLDSGASAAGDWYLTLTATAAKDPLNPVTLDALVSRTNLEIVNTGDDEVLPPVPPLGLTSCSDPAQPITKVHVPNKNYRHFHIIDSGNLVGQAQGNQVLEFRVIGLTEGAADVSFQSNNLATTGCARTTTVCQPDDLNDCVITINCAADLTHVSVYARSTRTKPIVFDIQACVVTEGSVSLNDTPAPHTVDAAKVEYYKVGGGLAAVPTYESAATLVRTTITGVTGAHEVSLQQASCTTCGTAPAVYTTTCAANADCELDVFNCQLPVNYATPGLDWFVKVDSTAAGNYDLAVETTPLGNAVAIVDITDPTVVTVPANGWAFTSWTFTPPAPVAPVTEQSLSIKIEVTKTSAAVPVTLHYNPSAALPLPSCAASTSETSAAVQTFAEQRCCIPEQTHTFGFRNDATNNGTIEVHPIVVVEMEGRKEGAFIDHRVNPSPYNVNARKVGQDVVIANRMVPYPGLVAPDASMSITVSSTNRGKFYYRTGSYAGPSDKAPCLDHTLQAEVGPGTTNNPEYHKQHFSCASNPIYPTDMWFGFESLMAAADADQDYTFFIEQIPNEILTFADGVESPAYTAPQGEFHQIKVEVPNLGWLRRQLKITFHTDGPTDVYVNRDSPAGPASEECLSNIFTGTASNSVNATTQLASCDSAGLYYLAFRANADDLNVIVKLEFVDDEPAPEAITETPIAGSDGNVYVATSDVSVQPNLSYLQFLFTDNAPVASSPEVDNWFMDGQCSSTDTSYCTLNPSDPTCSVIIFPCQMNPLTEYFVEANPRAGAVSFNVNARTLLPGRNFIPAPVAPETQSTFFGTVKAHELAIFTVEVDRSLQPGQSLSLDLLSIECGKVEVWINFRSAAGPQCNIKDVPCTTADCNLFSLHTCDTADEDHGGEYWITVRGLEQDDSEQNIKFSLGYSLTGGVTFRSLHVQEKETLYAEPIPVVAAQACPLTNTLPLPETCCLVTTPVVDSDSVQLEDVNLVYPIEGSHFFENRNFVTLELSEYVSSATINIDYDDPHYCATTTATSRPDNNNAPVGITANRTRSCTATTVSDRTCTIELTECEYNNNLQIFAYVDPASVVFNAGLSLSAFPDNRVPAIFVHNHRNQNYGMTLVEYAATPQIGDFFLAEEEATYIRIDHTAGADVPNFLFHGKVVGVVGGTVDFVQTWNTCAAADCTDVGYCVENGGSACSPEATCTCGDELLPCDPRVQSVDDELYSYYKLVGHPDVPKGVVHAKLSFEFAATEQPIEDMCYDIYAAENLYFENSLQPGPTDLFHITLQSFQDFAGSVLSSGSVGLVRLNAAEKLIALDGGCGSTATCDSNDQSGCTIVYRRQENPRVGVYGASNQALTHFKISAKLESVPTTTLNSGVANTSPTLQDVQGCVTSTSFEHYTYTHTSGDYMLVELQAAAGSTVYLFDGAHVTYLWGTDQCTTDASGYCYILVACKLNSVYNLHVPNANHVITVTSDNVVRGNLAIDVPSSAVLPNHQVYSYQLDVANAGANVALEDLEVRFSTTELVDAWITRGAFGDASCAVTAATPSISSGVMALTPCSVHKSSDTFFVNFLARGAAGACTESQFTVTAYFDNAAIEVVNGVATAATVSIGTPKKFRYSNIGPLGDNDVAYVRLTDVTGGILSHNVHKIHHASAVQTGIVNGLPCTSSCSAPGQFGAASWHESCFHCGGGIVDALDVEVSVAKSYGLTSEVTFSATVVKTVFTPLSSSPAEVNMDINPDIFGDDQLAFFSADLAESQANRIEVNVLAGPSVTVHVYAECNTPVTIECHLGHPCELPFPRAGNYADRYEAGNVYSGKVKIVISGSNARFNIAHYGATAACTAVEAGSFCETSLAGQLAFGNGQTFSAKSLSAEVQFDALVQAFSCPSAAKCECVPITQECRDAIMKFSCENNYGVCDAASGQVISPEHLTCYGVESACGRTFVSVGHPEFHCNHAYYFNYELHEADKIVIPGPPTPTDAPTTDATTATPTPSGTPTTDATTATPTPGGSPTPTATGAPTSTTPTGTTATPTTQQSTAVPTGTTPGGSPTPTPTSATATPTVATATPTPGGSPAPSPSPTQATGVNPTTSDANNSNAEAGLPVGAIIGIIIGAVVLLAAIAAAVYFLVIRPKASDSDPSDYKMMGGSSSVELY
eukprot:TRINITY_DN252_c0_g1_i1.p1 TRINITY_DN252_c0_g1~~TRINITY_DN252_c0_g1_i1.p1  ORF type:complete len:3200 (+),score=861.54 TRINITY_DN252_c0_g1_i1:298-9600(+)